MSYEIKKRATLLYDIVDSGIVRIADWGRLLPALQQTKDYLGWIKTTIENSPPDISVTTDEVLLDYLYKAIDDVAILGSIPELPQDLYPVVTTSGSSTSNEYSHYVRNIGSQFYNNPEVSKWVKVTIAFGEELKAKQNRSEIVHNRLSLLHPTLEQLHSEVIELCLRAQAEKDRRPTGASMTLTRLLDQFRGALIARCRGGDGSTYARISERLAANSALTKTVVLDGQNTYNDLLAELLEIRKKMQKTSGDRIVEMLREIEDHVIVITDALDPTNLGITY